MDPSWSSRTAPPTDLQDLINTLLATAVQAAAVLTHTTRVANFTAAAGHQRAAADLADTAGSLVRIRDAMMRAADEFADRDHL